MTTDRGAEYLASLVRELCKLHETEWLEFKQDNADPHEIGEYLSALANAAAYNGKAFAYLVWGVEDREHRIVGTRFDPLASLMRRFRFCEERGSGIDKVVAQIELFQLPAPLFETPEGFTRAVLFAHKPLSAMDKADRVRGCYLHACLCHVTRKEMTNTSLRARFGVEERNRSVVSRLIREAVAAGVVVPVNPDAAPKLMCYQPYWASSKREGLT